jgi:metallo-beta-lactamase family protein
MKLSFHGAAGEVTGSCSLLNIGEHNIVVDCGAFQGGDYVENRNLEPFGFDPSTVSAVFITHAHLDHIGRLPILVKQGFNGFIYATPPTKELTQLILADALSVMEYNNKKYGSPILFDEVDVNNTMGRFKTVDYHEELNLKLGTEEIKVKFYDAGHIFGSAFVEINAENKKIVFSGDIGNENVPIIKDTENLSENIDLLVCESTYGDRLHNITQNRNSVIEDVIYRSVQRHGTLMIPAFSLERTQELLYVLNDLIDRQKRLPPDLPIFLDSPLSINATEVFKRYPKYYDEEANQYFKSGDNLFEFAGLKLTASTDESKRINLLHGPKVIIAGAGMMNGGRILHHALRYLSDEKNTLFFVGFQAQHTLGRRILEGAHYVDIFGNKVQVNCHIETTKILSAHGDQDKLATWVKSGGSWPKKIILNHGEEQSSRGLQEKLSASGATVEIGEREKEIEVD